ncbi:unnamed protein product, partial [Adineta ricciae]
DFINEIWLKLMYSQFTNIYRDDFRSYSIYIFQGIIFLCESIDKTILENLKNFYFNEYISVVVTSTDLFKSQIDSLVNQFISSIMNTFLQSFQLIRSTTYANALGSAALTDHYYWEPSIAGYSADIIFTESIVRNGCSCGMINTCIEASVLYRNNDHTKYYQVPGMFLGCYILEALLQSTFECFYDETCINMIKPTNNSSIIINPIPLNASLDSQYLPYTTLEIILNQLMIEKWNWSILYELYFIECQPNECRYTYETRNDAIYIITTVIGLLGGLVTALKFVISKFCIRLLISIQKRKVKVVPIVPLQTANISFIDQSNPQNL